MYTAQQARAAATAYKKPVIAVNTMGPLIDAIKQASENGRTSYKFKGTLSKEAANKLTQNGYSLKENTVYWSEPTTPVPDEMV